MALTEKMLGQVAPVGTSPVSVYSPPASTRGIVKTIVVCNTSGSAAKFRLFLDDDGTTYDETTALYWDVEVSPGIPFQIDTMLAMNNVAGNLAFRSDTANALTCTVFGGEIT
jgi:hypothetical protein